MYDVNKSSIYKDILDQTKEQKRVDMHSFHRYYGKLIPAIPETFIKLYTKTGDLILDPFCGSGTTGVEAKRLNRSFVGIDINPISTSITTVKTLSLEVSRLLLMNQDIIDLIKSSKDYKVKKQEIPFVVNIDNWFKDYVKKDLVILRKIIESYFTRDENKEYQRYKTFYFMVLSAIIRTVSNADPAHVFPGVSKKMRKLDKAGKLKFKVFDTYIRAIKKRAVYYSIYEDKSNDSFVDIINGDISQIQLRKYYNKVSLIVTNPPYISSVRYAETMKLELYWLEFLRSQKEYINLSRKIIGHDNLLKRDYTEMLVTKYSEINEIIDEVYQIDPKSGNVIAKYFQSMEKAIEELHRILKDEGRVVMKISDSNIRKVKVETGKLLTIMAEHKGFVCEDVFTDQIQNRSLLTARNTYSDIILHDYIITWKKVT